MILFYMILAFFVMLSGLELYGSKNEHKIFMTGWAYATISAAAVGFYPWLNPVAQPQALMALALLISVPLFVILLGTKNWSATFLGALMYLNAGVVFYNGWGFANAGSFDAAIFMAALPIFAFTPVFKFGRSSYLFHLGFAIFLMLWTRSNTAAMILASYAVFYSIKHKIVKDHLSAIGALGILTASVLSIYFKGLGSGSARLEGWKHYMTWWWDNANRLVGTGIGTFEGMGPFIPHVPKTEEIYLYMHNDYLQMLFEGGIIGLLLMLVGCAYFVFKTKRSYLAYSVLGFLVCMISYSPLHIIIGQIAVCTLVFNIIYERNEYAKRN